MDRGIPIKLRLPRENDAQTDAWRVRLPLPPASRSLNSALPMFRAVSSPVIERALVPAPAPASTASLSGSMLAHASTSKTSTPPSSSGPSASTSAQVLSSDLPRRARELAENAARCALVAPGSTRRSVATLLQAAAAAEDEVLSPEQLAKLTKRVLNRASVQKCRRKQRERALRLEGERAALGRENALLLDVKRYVEACGALNMVRDASGMRWRQRQ